MAEYNSFAAVGQSRLGLRATPGTPGMYGDDEEGNELDETGSASGAPIKEITDKMQELLDSHNRAAVRGKLTKEEEVKVNDVQKRIRLRKEEDMRLKEKADIDARRRKVLFDDHSSAVMQEAAAAAASIKESLKQKTIASKLKEQGKTKATGKIDKSDRHGLPPPTKSMYSCVSLFTLSICLSIYLSLCARARVCVCVCVFVCLCRVI